MTHTWYCPNCGQPMEARRDVDNATGRATFTIGCLNPKHYRTPAAPTERDAERRLERLFGRSDA